MPKYIVQASNRKRCQKCQGELRFGSKFCSKKCKNESQKKRIIIVCGGCSKKFSILPYLKRQTNYCSINCYWESTRLKKKRLCKICSKEFMAPAHSIRKGFGIYCSRKCQHKAYPKKVVKICPECKKRFRVQPARADLRRFCSKKCKDDFERDYVDRVCRNCNKPFCLPRWELNKGKGTFCSRECYIQHNGETSIEAKVRGILEKSKISFQQEVKIGIYRADFLLVKSNIVIECDGEYWHSKQCSKDRDRRKDSFLIKEGYRVVRFSEQMIKGSSEMDLLSLLPG